MLHSSINLFVLIHTIHQGTQAENDSSTPRWLLHSIRSKLTHDIASYSHRVYDAMSLFTHFTSVGCYVTFLYVNIDNQPSRQWFC